MAQRLRLHELHLSNFLCHQDTNLDLRVGRLIWLVGNYGDGKSAIRDSIEYLLLGSARGLYRKDSDDLAYDPAVLGLAPEEKPRRLKVEAIVEFGTGGDAVSMHRGKVATSHTQQQIMSFLRVPDMDVVSAVLDASRFIDLDAEGRMRLVDRVLGRPVTVEELTQAGVDDEEVQRACLRSIKTGANLATAKRRAADTALKGATSVAPVDETIEGLGKRLSELDPEVLNRRIGEAVYERDKLVREVAGRKGMTAGGLQAREQAVTEAAAAVKVAEVGLAKAKKALETFEKSKDAAVAKEAEKNLALLRPVIEGEAKKVKDAVAVVAGRESAVRKAEDDYRKAGALRDGPCPTCGKNMKAAERMSALETAKKAEQGLLDTARADLAEAEGLAKLSTDKAQALQDLVDAHKVKSAETSSAVARGDEVLQDAQDRLAEAEKAHQIAKSAAGDQAGLQAKEAEVKKSDLRIENARALHLRILGFREARRIHAEAEAKVDQYRKESERFARMETALSDEGILASRSAPGLKALQDKVAAFSAKACPRGWAVSVDDRAGVLFNGVSVGRVSDGQRWVAGAVVAAALASLSGLGFLFLDRMAELDAEGRDRIIGILNALTKGENPELGQVFFVTLRDRTGWCDRCQEFRTRVAPYTCRDCKKRQPPEENPVVMARPKGPMIGHLRLFEFVGPGMVEEVLPAEGAKVGA